MTDLLPTWMFVELIRQYLRGRWYSLLIAFLGLRHRESGQAITLELFRGINLSNAGQNYFQIPRGNMLGGLITTIKHRVVMILLTIGSAGKATLRQWEVMVHFNFGPLGCRTEPDMIWHVGFVRVALSNRTFDMHRYVAMTQIPKNKVALFSLGG